MSGKSNRWLGIWLVPVIVLVFFIGIARKASPDGVRGLILSTLFKDTTLYAPQFSEDRFKSVQIGADTSSVLRILGEPLERDVSKGLVRWRYTKSSSDSHYRVRQIIFRQGIVIEKSAYYLVD